MMKFFYFYIKSCYMWKTRTFLLLTLLLLITSIHSQVYKSESLAFSRALELNRPVFLVFAGSDWCVPCIRFEKEVLSDSAFIRYAKDRLVILKADFPQRKKLPQEMVLQNEKLAEKYNPSGLFPHLLLLQPDGTLISEIRYRRQNGEGFAREVDVLLSGYQSPEGGLHPMLRDSIPFPGTPSLREFQTKALLMGCTFEFTVVDTAGSERVWQLIKECIEEVKRIENLISEWNDTTQIGRLNSSAGIRPVRLSPEVYELVSRSITISDLTQGAFDITFQGVGNLWEFDPKHPVIPDSTSIKKALQSVGYQTIALMDSGMVFLPSPGMKIGLGGIGKGYAAESVKRKLLDKGIEGGVINASGDLTAWGNNADGEPWKVGIADPEDPSKVLLWLPVKDAAVATSGNYEKYVKVDGERYGHILDPRTGYPVKGVKSVTVISPNAELSDALATGVFVMGIEAGLAFIVQLPDTHCIIVDDKNQIHYSDKIDFQLNK
jgi:thiamine biosynthesis lipoprotein